MRYSLALIAALLLSGAGCASTISGAYVQADRKTYDAVAPDYIAYINSDTTLKADDKKIKLNTISTWKLRLEHFEAESKAPVGSESK